MSIVITALPTGEPDVRRTPGTIVVADQPGSFPCRRCLRDAEVGERMLLVPYNPFEVRSPYVGEGPVFVHADGCEPYADDGVVPDQLRRRLLAGRAYDGEGMMVSAEVVEGTDLEAGLDALFAAPGAEFVHLHYARPGCFACRVDRSPVR
jgi:hypothetical protein